MLRDTIQDSSTRQPGLPAPPAFPFHSVLYPAPGAADRCPEPAMPPHFHDLLLDHVVAAVLKLGSQDFDLAPYFYAPLTDAVTEHATIGYRQEAMRDMENPGVRSTVDAFLSAMHRMREVQNWTRKVYYHYEKRWWQLEAVDTYCGAVARLADGLHRVKMGSQALVALRAHLDRYVQSGAFRTLASGTARLKTDVAAIRFNLLIRGTSITVQHYAEEIDYSAAVEATFDKFRRRAVKDYRVKFPRAGSMGHVEAEILGRVALLNPEVFGALDAFCDAHADFMDPHIARFDREIRFYAAYLDYIDTFRSAGLPFCYPTITRYSKAIRCTRGFDIALAGKLVAEKKPVICNDFELEGAERICVVSGPNQGGKTTFARMIGQLHYLGSLGFPVPGESATLFFYDKLFTHFEREEDITSLRGKLQDDLVRIHHILEAATPDSLIIMNEIFSSTTLKDAVFLATKVLERLSSLDALGVCVTFLSELSTMNEKMASFVSEVDPADPAIRTYRIERRPADGLAYAMALARKYHVTYGELKGRLQP